MNSNNNLARSQTVYLNQNQTKAWRVVPRESLEFHIWRPAFCLASGRFQDLGDIWVIVQRTSHSTSTLLSRTVSSEPCKINKCGLCTGVARGVADKKAWPALRSQQNDPLEGWGSVVCMHGMRCRVLTLAIRVRNLTSLRWLERCNCLTDCAGRSVAHGRQQAEHRAAVSA